MNRMLFTFVSITVLFSFSAFAFDAPEFFEKKCSSCHSIGGGDDVGPDLKGVTERRQEEWLVKFIKDSESVIKSGDPVANELFGKFKNKKMPAFELADDEIKSVLEFIKSGKGAGGAVAYRPATESNPFDIETGKQLFLGTKSLEKGGPACISCHGAGGEITAFGGGTLGPDLVAVSYANFGDKGLNKVIGKISFPTMAEVYSKSPLTEQENYYLRAFFMDENKKHVLNADKAHENGDPKNKFVLLSVVAASFGLLGMDVVWRKRRKKTKKPY